MVVYFPLYQHAVSTNDNGKDFIQALSASQPRGGYPSGQFQFNSTVSIVLMNVVRCSAWEILTPGTGLAWAAETVGARCLTLPH